MIKRFTFKNWSVVGSSIASDQTTLFIKEFGICFDMGFTFPDCVKKAKIVAISHGHQDHLGSLHLHIRKRLRNNLPGATYIIPKVCEEPFRHMYSSVIALDEGKDEVTLQPITGATMRLADESLNLTIQNQFFLKCYDMVHKIPSKGYVIFEKRRKLKPEYTDQSILVQMDKVANAKRDNPGVELENIVEVPLIAFSGDTTIEGVLQCEPMLNSKLLILECTYIDEKVSQHECKNRGHIHLLDILQNWNKFKNEQILLVHLSPRYTKEDIEKQFWQLTSGIRQRVQFFDLCSSYQPK